VKHAVIVLVLLVSGCGAMPWTQGPTVDKSACTASCNAHFEQCPRIFAAFPERGAVECPAEHDNCLRSCQTPGRVAVTTPALPPAAPTAPATQAAAPPMLQAAPGSPRPAPSKEARLRELKHFYEEGLVTEDVYKDRQKAILSEP
jgi:hypothetical protein